MLNYKISKKQKIVVPSIQHFLIYMNILPNAQKGNVEIQRKPNIFRHFVDYADKLNFGESHFVKIMSKNVISRK